MDYHVGISQNDRVELNQQQNTYMRVVLLNDVVNHDMWSQGD